MNASTPTCVACGTKFPGRDVCKSCGCDPHTGDGFKLLARAPVVVTAADPRQRRRQKALLRSQRQQRHGRKHGRQL